MVFRGRGMGGQWEIIQGDFFIGWWNLTGSDSDYPNLFESLTQHSVNIEHQHDLCVQRV